MNDIFDYLAWRGDLTFGNAPLCPVDALIFSLLSYLRLEPFVPADLKAEPVRLCVAAERYFARPTAEQAPYVERRRLLRDAAKSTRFGQLRLVGARREWSHEAGVQFAAVTMLLPGQNLFVAFEGTDDTLLGWEEDFRMSYECPVPAQLRALGYLRDVAAAFPLRHIFVGGHSKGGNLAMYAAVHAGADCRDRVRRVFNNDGPGFCDDTLSSPAYLALRDRIMTYLPQSSIVGVLLEHDDNYRIVKSNAAGLAQHDAYTWQVRGADFVYAAERTAFGKETEAIADRFINEMSPARRRQFTETLFSLLAATGEDTVSGIRRNRLQSAKEMIRAFSDLPESVRQMLFECLGALQRAARPQK